MLKYDCNTSEFFESLNTLLVDGSVLPIYVSGSSMNPFLISRRDIVWVKAFNMNDVKVGNIVLFRREDDSLVLHRIVRVLSDNKIRVMGDAQSWFEEIDNRAVIAVVTEIQRKDKIRGSESFYWKAINKFWYLLMPFRSVIMRIWFRFHR